MLKNSIKRLIQIIQHWQRANGEYVLTLFDDEFIVVDRFIDVNQENVIQTTFVYILTNIGDIIEIFEMPNDPLLFEMLRRIRR